MNPLVDNLIQFGWWLSIPIACYTGFVGCLMALSAMAAFASPDPRKTFDLAHPTVLLTVFGFAVSTSFIIAFWS